MISIRNIAIYKRRQTEKSINTILWKNTISVEISILHKSLYLPSLFFFFLFYFKFRLPTYWYAIDKRLLFLRFRLVIGNRYIIPKICSSNLPFKVLRNALIMILGKFYGPSKFWQGIGSLISIPINRTILRGEVFNHAKVHIKSFYLNSYTS